MSLHTHTNKKFGNFTFWVLWPSSFLLQIDVLTWAKETSYFLPQTISFLPHVCIFVWSYYKTDEVNFSIVMLCKKQEPSFVVGHFSCIVIMYLIIIIAHKQVPIIVLCLEKRFSNYFRYVFFSISDSHLHLS